MNDSVDYLIGPLKESRRGLFTCDVAVRGSAAPGKPWKIERWEFEATAMREATAIRRGRIARLGNKGKICRVTRLKSEIMKRVQP